jgi:hypothetical protein
LFAADILNEIASVRKTVPTEHQPAIDAITRLESGLHTPSASIQDKSNYDRLEMLYKRFRTAMFNANGNKRVTYVLYIRIENIERKIGTLARPFLFFEEKENNYFLLVFLPCFESRSFEEHLKGNLTTITTLSVRRSFHLLL